MLYFLCQIVVTLYLTVFQLLFVLPVYEGAEFMQIRFCDSEVNSFLTRLEIQMGNNPKKLLIWCYAELKRSWPLWKCECRGQLFLSHWTPTHRHTLLRNISITSVRIFYFCKTQLLFKCSYFCQRSSMQKIPTRTTTLFLGFFLPMLGQYVLCTSLHFTFPSDTKTKS